MKMKTKRIMIFLLLVFPFCSYCQTNQEISINDIGKIVIGVNVSDELNEPNSYTVQLKDVLKNKMLNAIANAGCSSFENSFFTMSPRVVIENTLVAEGGMKNIYVLEGHLYLTIKDSKIVYASTAIPFKASATSELVALRSAISNLSYHQITTFINEAKIKILNYYSSYKDVIFAQAERYAASGQFDEAITCLMMIPSDMTDLYQQASIKAIHYYEQKYQFEQKQIASEIYWSNDAILVEASNLLAAHNPNEALNVLTNFQHGDEEQNKAYNRLLKKAESLVSESERRKAQQQAKDRQDRLTNEARAYNIKIKNIDIQSQKINAVKTIACEYIRNNPSFRYYGYYYY